MAEVNWNILKTPDFGSDARQYRQAGLEDGIATQRRNILAEYSSDPSGSTQRLMGIDPEAAMRLQTFGQQQDERKARIEAGKRAATGDFAGARTDALGQGAFDVAADVAKMDADSRQRATENADALAAAATSLKGLSYDARKQQLQQIAPTLEARGLSRDMILGFDPTDDNIAGVIASAMDTKSALSQQNADRTFSLQQDNIELDNKRADEALAERQRAAREAEASRAAGLEIRRSRGGGSGKRTVVEMSDDELRAIAGVP